MSPCTSPRSGRATGSWTRSEPPLRIARAAGLHYVYCGNIHRLIPELENTESTFCPNCGVKVIDRETREVTQLWKVPGICQGCGTAIKGRWPESVASSPSAHQQLKEGLLLRW
eukprot:RCo015296